MSLTKASLLKKAKIEKPEKLGVFFGEDVYVRAPSELRRSRRAAMMFKDGKVTERYRVDARLYDVIDSVCDDKGEYIFTDADLNELRELDSFKMDEIVQAISEWVEAKGKNE